MSADRNLLEMLSANQLVSIEQRAVTPSYGLRQAADIGLLLGEIKRLERDNFALRDGLRGWQATAKAAVERAAKFDDFVRIVGEVSDAINAHDPHLEGSLVERVRQAMGGKRG